MAGAPSVRAVLGRNDVVGLPPPRSREPPQILGSDGRLIREHQHHARARAGQARDAGANRAGQPFAPVAIDHDGRGVSGAAAARGRPRSRRARPASNGPLLLPRATPPYASTAGHRLARVAWANRSGWKRPPPARWRTACGVSSVTVLIRCSLNGRAAGVVHECVNLATIASAIDSGARPPMASPTGARKRGRKRIGVVAQIRRAASRGESQGRAARHTECRSPRARADTRDPTAGGGSSRRPH